MGGKINGFLSSATEKSHLCLVFQFDVLQLRCGKLKAEFEQADRRQWEEVSCVNTTAAFNLPSFPCRGDRFGLRTKTF